MQNLIVILGDQLSFDISSLKNFDKEHDAILMAEVLEEASYVMHHKKKLVLIFSAMRQFASELRSKGFNIFYTKLDEKSNSNSLIGELEKAIKKLSPKKVTLTEPSEYRVLKLFDEYKSKINTIIDIINDERFICSHLEFTNYAKDKKTLLMENFYRLMRIKTEILMKKDFKTKKLKPIGDKWNYDHENRQNMPSKVIPPKVLQSKNTKIVDEVIELVNEKFQNNFGNTNNFFFATNHQQAEEQFNDFLDNRLSNFGIYQDAMRDDVEFGFHSIISIYINIGLLDAFKCCKIVEQKYYDNKCTLSSAEGFVRQIIGWREYIRGIYWHFMPQYKELNFFNHQRKIPEFYWDEHKTNMNCIKQVIKQTRNNAYSHHIQRLMITGNFALLAEISPAEINDWYLAVYADAFEWVELPNTHGMAIYADGGIVASKPYCSSGNYINKMSNFCKNCAFDVKKTSGENACPFNFLYWNFLIKNESKLKNNSRLFYPYANLKRKTTDEVNVIKRSAEKFLKEIN